MASRESGSRIRPDPYLIAVMLGLLSTVLGQSGEGCSGNAPNPKRVSEVYIISSEQRLRMTGNAILDVAYEGYSL